MLSRHLTRKHDSPRAGNACTLGRCPRAVGTLPTPPRWRSTGELCSRSVPRRPRILINAISLGHHGGGRSYVRNLLRELNRDDRGFEFAVLSAPGALSREEAGRLEVFEARLPFAQGPQRTIVRVAYEAFWMPFRVSEFDLLYCLADVSPFWCQVPTVVALRNLNIYDRRFYDTLRTRTLARLVKLGVRNAAAVLTPSRAAAHAIAPVVGVDPGSVQVVPHGISIEAFETDEPGEAPSPTRYLFLPANLERHKNISLLLDMLPRLADPEIQLWVAGGDDLDPACSVELRARVEQLSLEGRVRFLGPVPYEEILRLYRGALALVFPSWIETFGHPILEAMIAGTPVVAADIPSFREIAGDAALYFSPDDPRAAAQRVDEVVTRVGAAAERVALGRRRASEFTWSASTDQLCEVFGRVLSSNER